MKRLALFIVFPLIFGLGNDKARLCEDLKFAINKAKNLLMIILPKYMQ